MLVCPQPFEVWIWHRIWCKLKPINYSSSSFFIEKASPLLINLSYWDNDTTYSNAFSLTKMNEFLLFCHTLLFLPFIQNWHNYKLGDIAAKITSSLRKQTWGPSFSGSIWLESFMWFKYILWLNLTNTFLDKVCLWKLVGVQAIFCWLNCASEIL